MVRPEHVRKHIVIVGGGFAGLAAALELENLRQPSDSYNVTLIDRNCYHLYHALLYEVATAAMEITPADLEFLQSGVCVRLKSLGHILLKKNIQFSQSTVSDIKLDERTLTCADGTHIVFDYLVLALGSEIQYFNIPGLAEHSLSLKDLPDALQIHIRLDDLLARAVERRRPVNVLVGGGGVSGVEIAGELRHYARHLCRQRRLDPALMAVTVLEAGPAVLSGFAPWVQRAATDRLTDLGVTFHLGSPIVNVTDTAAQTKDGRTHPCDLFIWCGGIQANHLLRQLGVPCAGKKYQLGVAATLQLPSQPHVYAVGDGAYLIDPATNQPLPQVADVAAAEGRQAARNIYAQLHGQELQPYRPKHSGFVIPVGGRWAISTIGGIRLLGWLAWIVRKKVDLEYFLSILNWLDAWRVFWRGGRVYLKND